ncbi:hypothetical protein [Cellulomonas sp. C5510]|uniref:hypothetical protein n=1 Tax=Cellulomonas sp. C5510 TaxID=2871170 RepID=UPI001C93B805|nr:hypothetical protein [Cellulomonas sp. C5510]QZN85415.1 hypothetical protein K5O09_16890 [Cellulomonas sp. C5510]
MIALVVVLAAIEQNTGVHTWRHAHPVDAAARYLITLERWCGHRGQQTEARSRSSRRSTDPGNDVVPSPSAAPAGLLVGPVTGY